MGSPALGGGQEGEVGDGVAGRQTVTFPLTREKAHDAVCFLKDNKTLERRAPKRERELLLSSNVE